MTTSLIFRVKDFLHFLNPCQIRCFCVRLAVSVRALVFFVSALAGGEGASERIAEPTLASEKR